MWVDVVRMKAATSELALLAILWSLCHAQWAITEGTSCLHLSTAVLVNDTEVTVVIHFSDDVEYAFLDPQQHFVTATQAVRQGRVPSHAGRVRRSNVSP